MKKICMEKDLNNLRESSEIEKNDDVSALYELFEEFRKALSNGEKEFSLEEHGPIVILDTSDDLYNLTSAYLSESLFQTIPEEVTEFSVFGKTYWKILVLCNNNFLPAFIIPKDLMDRYPESKEYLQKWV